MVEDASERSILVSNFLQQSGLVYTHLFVKGKEKIYFGKGAMQRNIGLQWIRDNLEIDDNKGVVYFADDDNTYDLKLFDEVIISNTNT